MAKFTYTKVTAVYDFGDRGYEDEGYTFEYQPEGKKLRNALAHIIAERYFEKIFKNDSSMRHVFIDGLSSFLSHEELEDELAEYYYDELKEWFEEEAMESQEDLW